MMTYQRRRWRNMAITLTSIAGLYLWLRWQEDQLRPRAYSSGYVLLGTVVFLTAFHWRKKITFLPLGSASLWMQVHIYLGLFSLPLYLMHTSFRIPNGSFESLLAFTYLATATSGMFGLYVTRTFPRRLTDSTEEFIFERIPAHRYQLKLATRRLIQESVAQHDSSPLADFYDSKLGAYFEQGRGLRFHLKPTTRQRRQVMTELSSLQRYLSDQERAACNQLFKLIRKKDDLDYQYALQSVLKRWLYVHLALTYSLLILAGFHTVLAHGFRGSWQ